jgi:hypothetical protein
MGSITMLDDAQPSMLFSTSYETIASGNHLNAVWTVLIQKLTIDTINELIHILISDFKMLIGFT